MEEEFDLRGYVEALLRGWKWILGAGVVAGAVALVVGLIQAPTYDASALVIVTEPRYQLQLDPRFETTESWLPAYEAFPALAMSDGILQSLVDNYVPSPEAGIDHWSLLGLSRALEASSKGDPSLVLLNVTAHSAEDAAGIANLWADLLAEQGSRLFGASADEVRTFEAQLDSAQATLDEAEAELAAFRGTDQRPVLLAQLDSLLRTQADYLASQRGTAYLIQDAQSLRGQLAAQPEQYTAGLGDELAVLLLQIDAFATTSSRAIELSLDPADPMSGRSVAEQISLLDSLADTLRAKSQEIDDRLAAVEPQVLALQQELELVTAEGDRLAQRRDLAGDTYGLVAQKLEEARVAASVEGAPVRVGSYAAVPEEPVGPRKLLNTAVGGVLGLMVATFGVLVVDWWRAGAGRSGGLDGRGS